MYTQHCNRFKEYETWLKERNTQRYIDSQTHGQKIDGKNMLHCVRLIDTAMDIATGKGLVVRRANADYLKSIRHGKVDLAELLENAKAAIVLVERAFKNSDLPDNVDQSLIDNILYSIREEHYDLFK